MEEVRTLSSIDLKLDVAPKEPGFPHSTHVVPTPLPTPIPMATTPLTLHLPPNSLPPLLPNSTSSLHTPVNCLSLPTAPLSHPVSTPMPLPPSLEGLTPDTLRAFFPYGFDPKALSQIRYDLMRSLPHIYGSLDPRQPHYSDPKKKEEATLPKGGSREKEDPPAIPPQTLTHQQPPKGEDMQQQMHRREIKGDSRGVKADELKAQLAKYHCHHLMRSIRTLHKEQYGFDTVILCEGGFVKAHCCILACASPFLKKVLVESKDFPYIVSLPGILRSTMENLISCIYFGSMPLSANLNDLIDAAQLLGMESIVAVFKDAKDNKDLAKKSMSCSSFETSSKPSHNYDMGSECLYGDAKNTDKVPKRRGNRLDQILYHKLNANHLAPETDLPPPLNNNFLPENSGILGELLTKNDYQRQGFSSAPGYQAFDANRSNTPLNLSKSKMSVPITISSSSSSSVASISSSTPSSSSASKNSPSSSSSYMASATSLMSGNLAASGITPSAFGLVGFPSLTGTMTNMFSQLPSSTLSPLINPSAFVSLTSSSNYSPYVSNPALTTSKGKISSSLSRPRHSKSHLKPTSLPKSKSSSSINTSMGNNTQVHLPLLYSLKSPTLTPEVLKELYEQLKLNPQLSSSLAGLTNLPPIPNLTNPSNIASFQGFQGLFPNLFAASASAPSTAPGSSTVPVGSAVSVGSSIHVGATLPISSTVPFSSTVPISSTVPLIPSVHINSTALDGVATSAASAPIVSSVAHVLQNPKVRHDPPLPHETTSPANITSTVGPPTSESVALNLTCNYSKSDSNFEARVSLNNNTIDVSSSRPPSPTTTDDPPKGMIKPASFTQGPIDFTATHASDTCPVSVSVTPTETGHRQYPSPSMSVTCCEVSSGETKNDVKTSTEIKSESSQTSQTDSCTQTLTSVLAPTSTLINSSVLMPTSALLANPAFDPSAIPSSVSFTSSPSLGFGTLGLQFTIPSSVSLPSKYSIPSHISVAATSELKIDSSSPSNDPVDLSPGSCKNGVSSSSHVIPTTENPPEETVSDSMMSDIDVVGSPSTQDVKPFCDSFNSQLSPELHPCDLAVPQQKDSKPATPDSVEVIEESLVTPDRGTSQIGPHPKKTTFQAGNMGRKRKGCGECEGCQVVDDCGNCRFCRDKAKFGGPNRLKQVCVYKRCVLIDAELDDGKKKRKNLNRRKQTRCGSCDGCQRTSDCGDCYACLHNAAAQAPARKKICEMRVCEQQQIEEVRASLNVAEEPSPYSTDSLIAEGVVVGVGSSRTSSPNPDGSLPCPNKHKLKLSKKAAKKLNQPFCRMSPSKVRTKYYCGECPGCLTTTPCGNCLYCEDMPKFGGPGRYRQKCVKQLCVYHPRLQALKLSNRSKVGADDQPHDLALATSSSSLAHPNADVTLTNPGGSAMIKNTMMSIQPSTSGTDRTMIEGILHQDPYPPSGHAPSSTTPEHAFDPVAKSLCWNPYLDKEKNLNSHETQPPTTSGNSVNGGPPGAKTAPSPVSSPQQPLGGHSAPNVTTGVSSVPGVTFVSGHHFIPSNLTTTLGMFPLSLAAQPNPSAPRVTPVSSAYTNAHVSTVVYPPVRDDSSSSRGPIAPVMQEGNSRPNSVEGGRRPLQSSPEGAPYPPTDPLQGESEERVESLLETPGRSQQQYPSKIIIDDEEEEDDDDIDEDDEDEDEDAIDESDPSSSSSSPSPRRRSRVKSSGVHGDKESRQGKPVDDASPGTGMGRLNKNCSGTKTRRFEIEPQDHSDYEDDLYYDNQTADNYDEDEDEELEELNSTESLKYHKEYVRNEKIVANTNANQVVTCSPPTGTSSGAANVTINSLSPKSDCNSPIPISSGSTRVTQPSTTQNQSIYKGSSHQAATTTTSLGNSTQQSNSPVALSYNLNVTSNGSLPLTTVTLPPGHLVNSNMSSFSTVTQATSLVPNFSFSPSALIPAHSIFSNVTPSPLSPPHSEFPPVVFGTQYHRKSPQEVDKHKLQVNGPNEETSSQDSIQLSRDVNENLGPRASV